MDKPQFYSKEHLLDTYEKQRKDRVGDAIGDYLTDEQVDSRRVYEDILSEVQIWIDYHSKFLKKAEDLYALLKGERPVI